MKIDKKMKKVMMFSAALAMMIATASPAFCQTGKDPDKMVDKRVQKLDQTLNLSSDQEAKLKEIYLSYAQKEQARRQERKQDRIAMDNQLKTVLSTDQYNKLQQMRAQKIADRISLRAEERSQQMKQQLGLNDQQTQDVKAALQQHFQNMLDIRKNADPNKQDDTKAQMKEEQQRFRGQLKGILTPDQMNQLKALKRERHQGRMSK